jgi:hypothetical protein
LGTDFTGAAADAGFGAGLDAAGFDGAPDDAGFCEVFWAGFWEDCLCDDPDDAGFWDLCADFGAACFWELFCSSL